MKTQSLLSLLLLCSLTSCTCKRGSIIFEAPLFATNRQYTRSGASIYNNGQGLAANVGVLTFDTGLTAFKGCKIDSLPPYPFGDDQVLHMNNAVLDFDLAQYTTTAVFEYLDLGGTVNIGAHGGKPYIGNINALPANFTSGGATIVKSGVQKIVNPQGVAVGESGIITVKMNSDIGNLLIGGEELYLDNFCFD